MTAERPTILFVCRHNAGRSQIAAGLARHHLGDRATVSSGGIEPADTINPVGAQALLERGIDITDQRPRAVTADDLTHADIIITLVQGVDLAIAEGVQHEAWQFPDPASWGLEHIRPLVDQIDVRVNELAQQIRS